MSGTSSNLRSARGALLATLQIVLVLVFFAAFQFLAGRHNVRFDLTPTHRFLLSPYARQTAEAFTRDATLYAFYDSQQVVARRRMLDLLGQFHSYAPGLQFDLIDLDRNPGLSKKYGISRYGTGVLELATGQRLPVHAITEEEVTSTLLRLTRNGRRRICFVTGHGEGRPDDGDERSGFSKLSNAIEHEGFTVSTLATVRNEVPSDCAMLVFIAPTHELTKDEMATLEKFGRGGGRSLFLLDPGTPESFDELLSHFGIAGGTNIIVDESSRMIGADSFVPQVDRFRQEVFKNRLGASAILPVARTIRATGDRPPGVRVLSLAGTSDASWARVNTIEVPSQDVQFRPGIDEAGPLSICAQAIIDSPDRDNAGQIVAIGDSDFASNAHIDTLGNRDFALAVIGILAEDPSLIGMRHDTTGDPQRPLSLNAAQTRNVFWVAVVALPGLSALAGLALGLVRRRKRGGR